MKEGKRTNITILNDETWNWAKSKKNELNLPSTSSYLNKLLNHARKGNLDERIFLEAMEKYYEFTFYDMEWLKNETGLELNGILKITDKILGDIPLHGDLRGEQLLNAVNRVHINMLDRKIMPREIVAMISISWEFETDNLADPKDIGSDWMRRIIKCIFPDDDERKMEVYYTHIKDIDMLSEMYEKITLKCPDCGWKEICPYNNLTTMHNEIGVDDVTDEWKDDLVMGNIQRLTTDPNERKKMYGLTLVDSTNGLIYKYLNRIIGVSRSIGISSKCIDILHRKCIHNTGAFKKRIYECIVR